MAYLTDSGKTLLKEALFKLDLEDDSWALPELLGYYVGGQVSLLGCTNNPQSLNAVYAVVSQVIGEINELRTFRVEPAVNNAKYIVGRRYDAFFKGIDLGQGVVDSANENGRYCFEALNRKNTAEIVNQVFDTFKRVIQSSGITVLIHNQQKEEAAPTPAPEA